MIQSQSGIACKKGTETDKTQANVFFTESRVNAASQKPPFPPVDFYPVPGLALLSSNTLKTPPTPNYPAPSHLPSSLP